MKIVLRPLAPGETDAEALFFWVALAAGVLGVAWLHWGFPLPECPVARWTGLPCPTCGGTRMALALLAGNGAAALRFNPLLTVAFGVGAVYLVYCAAVLAFGLRRVRFGKFPEKFGYILRGAAVLVFLANWIWLACTLTVGPRGESGAHFDRRGAVHLDIAHTEGG